MNWPVIFYYAYSSISSRSNGVLPESIAQDDPVQAEPIPALFTPEPLPAPLPPVITTQKHLFSLNLLYPLIMTGPVFLLVSHPKTMAAFVMANQDIV
ncbi:MAG: hypothetical protein IPP22_03395 [Nitrosomonas sp.]|nr:hypothetical protein [Nitrosomonas sp.]